MLKIQKQEFNVFSKFENFKGEPTVKFQMFFVR